MGQLERYGLYVLCLVIVLILGVAIWGGDPAHADPTHNLTVGQGSQIGAEGGLGQGSGTSALPEPPGPGEDTERFFDQTDPGRIDLGNVLGEDDQLEGLAVVPPTDPVAPPDDGLGRLRDRGQRPDDGSRGNQRPPAPRPGTTTYTVRDGDTIERIAKRELRSIKYVAQILELNPGVDPKRMQIGSELTLPAAGTGGSKTSKSGKWGQKAVAAGWREYTVQDGDSPYTISVAMYGTHKYAKKIMETNGITDPRRMKANSVLRIPPLK